MTASTIGAVPVDPAVAKRLTAVAKRARDNTDERNRLIRQAHADGGSLREIGALAGLTHVGVKKIVERGR